MMVIVALAATSCLLFIPDGDRSDPIPMDAGPLPTSTERPAAPLSPSRASPGDKWSLWTGGTQLRGANVYQRRVFPEMDGTEFYGPGPFGPPYTQDDFDRLASLGANYVNISTAGLYTIEPPYAVDEEAVAALDRLLEMAAAADMFAVITFRTGPGRSEFAIIGDETWPPEEYVVNAVWTDGAARAAWAEMWRFAAARYRDNPVVAGYDLMCEPNSNAILDLWDPQAFYDEYSGTGYDWNSWYPDIVSAIRAEDSSTPILVGGNSYSAVEWLPYLQTVDDPRVVYAVHQYAPHAYTHPAEVDPARSYPGVFDLDDDGEPENFDGAWLEDLLAAADEFSRRYGVPVAVNEFGAERWTPGAAEFVRDEMDLFERHGWNYAVWQWQPAWPPLAEGDNSFNFRFGPDPAGLADADNDLFSAYLAAWSRNLLRPSNFRN